MDDFLREIQTSLFREWINNQKRDYHTLLSEVNPIYWTLYLNLSLSS